MQTGREGFLSSLCPARGSSDRLGDAGEYLVLVNFSIMFCFVLVNFSVTFYLVLVYFGVMFCLLLVCFHVSFYFVIFDVMFRFSFCVLLIAPPPPSIFFLSFTHCYECNCLGLPSVLLSCLCLFSICVADEGRIVCVCFPVVLLMKVVLFVFVFQLCC